MIEESDAICGTTPAGSWAWIAPRRSLTRTRASVMSVAHANSAATIAKPMPEVERTVSTPGVPLSRLSIGRVTSRSTSSGARPSVSAITVTVGRVRSGKTSTGSRGSRNIRRSPASRPPANTNSRYLRLLETRKLNMPAPHRTWLMSSAPLTTTRWPGIEPRQHDELIAIDQLPSDGLGDEPLRRGVLPNDHFPVRRPHDRLTRQNDALHQLFGLDQHRRGLPHHQRSRGLLDRELKMGGMQLQHASDALILELERPVMVLDRESGKNIGGVEAFERKGLDPHRVRIDDMKHLVLWGDDLARQPRGPQPLRHRPARAAPPAAAAGSVCSPAASAGIPAPPADR